MRDFEPAREDDQVIMIPIGVAGLNLLDLRAEDPLEFALVLPLDRIGQCRNGVAWGIEGTLRLASGRETGRDVSADDDQWFTHTRGP